MATDESDIASDQHAGGHTVVASVAIDELVTAHREKVPRLRAGSRSFLYRFGSIEPGDKAANFGALITRVEGESSDPWTATVHLHFWADLSASHATKGASFDVWYGSVVGGGRIEQVLRTPPPHGRVTIELTKEERDLLRSGILDWGGPARCTNELPQEMGFKSVADLFDEGDRLRESLKFNEPLSRIDWRRSLLAAETCFTHPLGSTTDWETTTGFMSADTKRLLATIHQKLDAGLAGDHS